MSRGLPVLAACLILAGCEKLGFVEKGKYEALQQQVAEVQQKLEQTREELKKAQEQVSECHAHKYEIYRSGLRTWRLDTVTGKTCILLTSEEDWKNPETTASGCQCENALNDASTRFEVLEAMGCFGKVEGKK